MFEARLFLRSSATEVVPVVVATVLLFRSATDLILESAFTAVRTSVTYVVSAKDTSFWRVALLVVEPHSMSTVPFCTRGMRLAEVTGTYSTDTPGRTAFRMRWHSSTW